jgi:protease IV
LRIVLLAMNPVNAEKLGMIKLGYWDQFESLLKSAVKIKAKNELTFVKLADYLKAKNPIKSVEGTDKIGVLVAEGEIVGTKGGDDNIGSDDFVKELRKLRDNKSVKAIVFESTRLGAHH